MLGMRIKYGCNWTCARLCGLDGIGKVRAAKLVQAGIRSVEDFRKESQKCIEILGEKIYNNATVSYDESTGIEAEYPDVEV